LQKNQSKLDLLPLAVC